MQILETVLGWLTSAIIFIFQNPKIIPYLMGLILCFVLWTSVKGFILGPHIVKKPESTTTSPQIDWSDEAASIDYASQWFNYWEKHVLTECIPKHIAVKECAPK